jgi:protein phosphatase
VEQLRAWPYHRRGSETPSAHNAITRAVGAPPHDLETLTLDVRDGDMFLLCSDGLYNDVDDTDIASVLASGDCRHAADELVRLALAHGGQDNVTVVVIRASEADGSSESSSSPDTTG